MTPEQTLLKALQAADVEANTSCEEGVCGSCESHGRCRSGHPLAEILKNLSERQRNEVMLRDDLEGVRQELSVNPNVLLPVIREALSMLAVDSKSASVRLHPRDLAMLRDALETEFAGMALTLLPDAAVRPGGCLIAASGTVIDGTLDTRWRRAVASLGLDARWEE